MLKQETVVSITQLSGETYTDRGGSLLIPYNVSFEINSNVDNLTTTLKLTIPKFKKIDKINNKDKVTEYPLLLIGDYLMLSSSYDFEPNTNRLFNGFITSVKKNDGVIDIECDDFMYILKKTECPNVTWNTKIKTVDETKFTGPLESLINYLFKTTSYRGRTLEEIGLSIEVDNTKTDIGIWTLTSSNTIANFLEELRNKFKFKIFFRNRTLYCSLVKYSPSLLPNTYKDQSGNTINRLVFEDKLNIISKNLQYKTRDEQKIKLKAIGISKDELNTEPNKKVKKRRVEETVGDADGTVITWHCLDNLDSDPVKPIYLDTKTNKYRSKLLREKALAILPEYKIDKAVGSINIFGYPIVQHSDIITLVNTEFENIKYTNNDTTFISKYFIKGVKTTGGLSGYRQEVELDYRYDTLTDSEKTNYLENKGIYDNKDLIEN